jgi:hypothetical protein
MLVSSHKKFLMHILPMQNAKSLTCFIFWSGDFNALRTLFSALAIEIMDTYAASTSDLILSYVHYLNICERGHVRFNLKASLEITCVKLARVSSAQATHAHVAFGWPRAVQR